MPADPGQDRADEGLRSCTLCRLGQDRSGFAFGKKKQKSARTGVYESPGGGCGGPRGSDVTDVCEMVDRCVPGAARAVDRMKREASWHVRADGWPGSRCKKKGISGSRTDLQAGVFAGPLLMTSFQRCSVEGETTGTDDGRMEALHVDQFQAAVDGTHRNYSGRLR